MRWRAHAVVLAVAAALATTSHASYELVMVADTGTNSVHRFDGTTGAYFGEFAKGFVSTISSFNIDASTGLAYLSDSDLGMTRVFNYSTGTHLADLSFGNNGAFGALSRRANGHFVDGFYNGASGVYDASGGLVHFLYTLPIGGSNSIGGASAPHASGRHLTVAVSFGLSQVQIYDADVPWSTAIAGSATVSDMGGETSVSQISVSGDRAAWIGNNNRVRYMSIGAGASSVTLGATGTISTFSSGTTSGIGWGHGNTVYIGGRNAGNTAGLLMRTVYGSTAALGTFGSNVLQQPRFIQTVVAPEPASLLALAGGLALLMRRKRR